uniref:Uncharacterized protein n=1 Tax=Arundo donax TaxID=35708 RepID=A0A0A9BAI9_ARUDO
MQCHIFHKYKCLRLLRNASHSNGSLCDNLNSASNI